MDWIESKYAQIIWKVILVLAIFYIGHHFIISKASAWDGTAEYNMDISGEDLVPNVDISVDTGTRQTIESLGQLKPGMNLELHDWETNTTKEVEITKIDPPTGGPVQMEGYDYDTGGYLDLRLDLN